MTPPTDVPLKDVSEWKIAGKPVKRLDTKEKLTGELKYGADIQLEGMLLASIKDAPVLGGKLKSFDAKAVEGMPGVRGVVKVETAVGTSGVAVVADTWWQANTALNALPIEWDLGPNADFDDEKLTALLESGLDADEAFQGNWEGDIKAALEGADRVILLLFVDDALTIAAKPALDLFRAEFKGGWSIRDYGEPKVFLGCDIERDRNNRTI